MDESTLQKANIKSRFTETLRLQESRENKLPWKKWGPYLSEHQWDTVREDYSPNGDAWNFFAHDQARSRAYRWGEDGLAGKKWRLNDLMHDVYYGRDGQELQSQGLYLDMSQWQYHVFELKQL